MLESLQANMGRRVGLLATMTASARHFDIVKLVIVQCPFQKLITGICSAHSEATLQALAGVLPKFFTTRDNSLSAARPSSVTSAIHISPRLIASMGTITDTKTAISNVSAPGGRSIPVDHIRHGLRDDALPFQSQLGSMPLMPALHSDDPNVEIDQPGSGSHAILKEGGRLFTIGWAVAGLVATAGWLYFIARAAWFLVDWFFG
jgi:hypothetical protein